MNNLKYILLSAVFFQLFSCSSVYNHKSSLPTFNRYRLTEVDRFTLPKVNPEDAMFEPTILKDGSFVYFSQSTDTLSIYNPNTRFHKMYKVIDWDAKAQSVGTAQISDSIILVYYHNANPYVNKKVFTLNIYTGKKEYPYEFRHAKFLLKDSVPVDSYMNNTSITFSKNRLGYGPPFVYDNGNSVVLPLMAGTTVPQYGELKTEAQCLVEMDKWSTNQNKLLDVRFNQTNSPLNKMERIDDPFGLYCFMPHILKLDDEQLLISFAVAKEYILYNVRTKQQEKIPVYPNFFLDSAHYFGDQTTDYLESIYYNHRTFSNPNFPYIISKIRMPYSFCGETRHKARFCRTNIVYQKDPEIKPIGILDSSGVYNIDHEGFLYSGIRGMPRKDREKNFHIKKCTLKQVSVDTGYYQPVRNKETNSKLGDYTDYLSKINPQLLKKDTIPIIVTYGVCGTCVHKAGLFLKGLEANDMKANPTILVTSNPYAMKRYYKDFNINHVGGINKDSTSALFDYMMHPESFGYLIKTNGKYKFERKTYSELKGLFQLINPNLDMVGDICVPKKRY